MIPDQLYQFVTAKDSAGGNIEACFATQTSAGTAATTVNSPIVRVPLDRVYYLANVLVQGIPTGGQNCTLVRLELVDEAGNALQTMHLARDAGAAVGFQSTIQPHCWIPPRFGLRCVAGFDAGVAVNFASISVAGILFPRANVQLGALTVG